MAAQWIPMRSFHMRRIHQPNICSPQNSDFSCFNTHNQRDLKPLPRLQILPASIRSSSVNSAWTPIRHSQDEQAIHWTRGGNPVLPQTRSPGRMLSRPQGFGLGLRASSHVSASRRALYAMPGKAAKIQLHRIFRCLRRRSCQLLFADRSHALCCLSRFVRQS